MKVDSRWVFVPIKTILSHGGEAEHTRAGPTPGHRAAILKVGIVPPLPPLCRSRSRGDL